MKVLPFRRTSADINLTIDFFEEYAGSSADFKLPNVSLDELLQESDFITLHVPFPKGSAPIIGSDQFKKMKKGVCIINTARGGAISETDLLQALNSGIVGHAALDVFEGEPLIKKEIREHKNISLTPHIGGSTKEAQERIGIELAEKVVQLLKNQETFS